MQATPTTAAALNGKGPRVLVCIGSESGKTKRLIKKIVSGWTERGATFNVDMMDGNDAIKRFGTLEQIAKNFDVMLVATCSYGCGEAPVSIAMLLEMLVNRATFDEAPLAGLQHAVLGSGSTVYETFQNCPRMHDKLLGECGSRRLVMRGELDDCHELSHMEQPDFKRWSEEVFEALQSLPAASSPPVCDWDKPGGRVTESLSASTSCPTDMGPYYFCAAGLALAIFVAAGHMMDWLPSPVLARWLPSSL